MPGVMSPYLAKVNAATAATCGDAADVPAQFVTTPSQRNEEENAEAMIATPLELRKLGVNPAR
jgi:hypothetical protein